VPTSSWCFVEAGEVTPAECKHRVLAAGLDAFVENRRSAEERGVPGGAARQVGDGQGDVGDSGELGHAGLLVGGVA
jgi:hypothetical protein